MKMQRLVHLLILSSVLTGIVSQFFCPIQSRNLPNLEDKECKTYIDCSKIDGAMGECPNGQLYDYFQGVCNNNTEVRCFYQRWLVLEVHRRNSRDTEHHSGSSSSSSKHHGHDSHHIDFEKEFFDNDKSEWKDLWAFLLGVPVNAVGAILGFGR